jgi:hypothetical protein
MEEFGSDGYLVFFGVIEIYSREFSTQNDWKLVEKVSYFHHNLLISSSRFKKILSKIYKWDVSYDGEYVSIFIPKYKELLDESTLKKLRDNEKSFRKCSGIIPKTEGTDKDKDKDKDKDTDKRSASALPLPDDEEEIFTLPDWIPQKTWDEFQKVRKKKKAACTPYAHNLVVKELVRIRDQLGQDPVAVLNKSITSGWSDVYPLKGGNGNGERKHSGIKAWLERDDEEAGQAEVCEGDGDTLGDIRSGAGTV